MPTTTTALLAAGLVVVAAIAVGNMLLTFALVRRLRGMVATGDVSDKPRVPQPGAKVGPFRVATTDGAVVDEKTLAADRTFVAFVSPTCAPCREIVGKLGEVDGPLLVFVTGDAGDRDTPAMVELLRDRRVAVVGSDSPAAAAFGGIDVYPTVVRVESGVVAAAGHQLTDVVAAGIPVR